MLFDVEKRAAPVHHCVRSPPMPDWLPISFTHPALLALLLLAPLAWWLERRSLVLLPRGRRIASLALRTVVILLLVLALAGMRFERRSDAVTVVFAVDRSDSVGADEVAPDANIEMSFSADLDERTLTEENVAVTAAGKTGAVKVVGETKVAGGSSPTGEVIGGMPITEPIIDVKYMSKTTSGLEFEAGSAKTFDFTVDRFVKRR